MFKMKEIITNIMKSLNNDDLNEHPYLFNKEALDREVENYCIDKGFIYYVGDLQALDAEEKREYLSELSYELKFYKNLYQNNMIDNKAILLQFLRKHKIFEAITRYDYHSVFNDYFTSDDMKEIMNI
ncbi:hypothetical protein [Salinicoccus kekensis]|uniref:Uncharacterized protein n=1 Tax=Salinicoccus kekensis TaxID=714307 RepID=A0A285UXX5_9STAP|nr:hypothetical protein [Salinicoccus kekensis]SOC45091.1 hypothetical protein SAMN05878391_2597 [Salinicoccus kekensis]